MAISYIRGTKVDAWVTHFTRTHYQVALPTFFLCDANPECEMYDNFWIEEPMLPLRWYVMYDGVVRDPYDC